MSELSDEIYEEFKKGTTNIKFKGSISVTLINNNEKFKSLSPDEIYSILPDDIDSRIDDIYTKHIKDPDLYPIFTLFYLVPADAYGFKVEVRDETTYSNEKALIDLGL